MLKNKGVYMVKKRVDGREMNELRPIKIVPSVIERADGSAYLEWGQNKMIVAVYGPKEMLPKHLADSQRGKINFIYRMAPFSVPERKNPKPGRRDIEISKVVGEALSHAVLLEEFPGMVIDVYVQILDSNAGTRVAALTASSVALADAGIPMKDLVTAVAVGKANGNIIADLNKYEEDAEDAVDMAFAMLPGSEEIVLLQADGILSEDEFDKAIKIAKEKCQEVKKLQIEALKSKFKALKE
ncbi:MAG: exosome complex exonuclease Rrp41 [Candidatus ainarchaeum sp.]|nr:exosome complex exonuclease Rrp41 [Candidatus ainarchaeum sp.]